MVVVGFDVGAGTDISRSTRSTSRPSIPLSSSCIRTMSKSVRRASGSKLTSTSTSLSGPKSSRTTEPNRASSATRQRLQKVASRSEGMAIREVMPMAPDWCPRRSRPRSTPASAAFSTRHSAMKPDRSAARDSAHTSPKSPPRPLPSAKRAAPSMPRVTSALLFHHSWRRASRSVRPCCARAERRSARMQAWG